MIWTGGTTRGYGRANLAGRSVAVHRFAYELEHGPIPDGMNVMHTCDTPRCFRVEHLRLGTQRENLQDAIDKGRIHRDQKGRYA